jgi:predicted ABC-class ATPase
MDGQNYPNYKSIKGEYKFPDFILHILHVQGDPFAAPTRLAITFPSEILRINEKDVHMEERRIGFEDALLRCFKKSLLSKSRSSRKGSGKSGRWGVLPMGQEILKRSACEIASDITTLRFTLGLPAAGRRILGKEALRLFQNELRDAFFESIVEGDRTLWRNHADQLEDQEALRELCKQENAIAFIAEKSLLPRASGVDDRPLDKRKAVLWTSPFEWKKKVSLPNYGQIEGTFIPKGIVIICGGGYHGKSTLLQTLSKCVYPHIPGDGREFCATNKEALSIRAEDGRQISKVDISPFINHLPLGKNTQLFSSENASGSTSQAANIIEGIEAGARCFLVDEDTSATNFMIRDRRMQDLIRSEKEPITPFIDQIEQLYEVYDISTVLAVGGAGDYLDPAHHVLMMDQYKPKLVTKDAKEIIKRLPNQRLPEKKVNFKPSGRPRIPERVSFFPEEKGKRFKNIKTRDLRCIFFGEEEIDVSAVNQILDVGQMKTIGKFLRMAREQYENARAHMSIVELLETYDSFITGKHLSELTGKESGDCAYARPLECAAALNRLRLLKIK